ncbi:SMI1/KNR4 family protein [Flavobacterium sp.]|jgi:hypothetical protein|uniref:SMI1/KNR4 family protein n=1 Tax=Flavobacterium sp. TaxID=239 RepID=UPI0037BF3332
MNKDTIKEKLKRVEKELNYKFPITIYDFILNLNHNEVELAEDIWCFNTVLDEEDENFILESSLFFEKQWKIKGVVIAQNFGGDELVLLDHNENNLEEIFVTIHETAEIKLFSKNINELIKNGPLDYYFDQNFVLKLDDDENPIWNNNFLIISENDTSISDRELKSKIDDLIDDLKFEKKLEIIQGLEKLTLSDEEDIKIWALNKLSELYLRGFGELQVDFNKAFVYNNEAINLNSYKAYASLAFCLMSGYGIEKNLKKSLEFAVKANELSKKNKYTKIVTENSNEGLYENLIKKIENEINKS